MVESWLLIEECREHLQPQKAANNLIMNAPRNPNKARAAHRTNLNPAPDLALQVEVWFAELGFEIPFLGQDDAEMQDDGERYDK